VKIVTNDKLQITIERFAGCTNYEVISKGTAWLFGVAGMPWLGVFWLTGLTPSPSPLERGMPPFMKIVGISKSNVSGF